MPTYEVTVNVVTTKTYVYNVEAADEIEAKEIAGDNFDQKAGRSIQAHYDEEVINVEETGV